jgi:hypothetical protein
MTSRDKHWIDLKSAVELTTQWRKRQPEAPKAIAFDRAALERILKQEHCAGVRCYFAAKADTTWTLVLVGINAKGQDLASGEIAEEGNPCPPDCDSSSPLVGGK